MPNNLNLPKGFRLTKFDGGYFVVRSGRERLLKDIARGRADLRPAPEVGGRVMACRLDPGRGGAPLLVKRYWRGGLCRCIMRERFLGTGRFLAELLLTEIAASKGLNVARIAGLVLRRVEGVFWSATLVTEEIEGALDLRRIAADVYPVLGRAARNALLKSVAREIRKMHDIGIFHADLHLKNILVRDWDGSPRTYIIDFDRGDYFKGLAPKKRLGNLMRLGRSAEKFNRTAGHISAADRLRLLKYYADGDGRMWRALKKGARSYALRRKAHGLWWRAISVFRKEK